jgi:hypothetical protein
MGLATLAVAAFVAGCPSTATDTPADADAAPPDTDAAVDTGPPCSRMTTLCGPDKACLGPPDCASGLCRDDVCRDIAPADGVKNGDETDVDCGGTKAPACTDNKGCLVGPDCTSSVCVGGICQPPSPTDGVQNGDETGKDCGGAKAPKCPAGEGCNATADCDKVKCDTVMKKCLPAAHDDGILNLDETGIDCGGPTMTVARCPTGEGCAAVTDCDNVLCNGMSKLCDPPTATDGLTNGTETDKDCGGGAPTNAPRCVFDKTCAADTDCANGGCSLGGGKKCAPRSCATTETAGIASCGALETGQAGAAHDSCCKSLVLPTRTTKRLDKYEITAGRFRTFLTNAGPNIRAFVTTYVAANPTSQLAQLVSVGPNVFPGGANVSTVYPDADRFNAHSLTAHMELDIDNYSGIRGCYNGYNPGVAAQGDYAANTYWMDATHEADFAIPPRTTPRSVSDEKPLNCAMPAMLAAFCAWDGGELATLADYHDAWVSPSPPAALVFPWGSTDLKRPNYNWCNGTYLNGGFRCQCDNTNHTNDPGGAPLFGPGPNNIGPSPNDKCPAGGFTTLSGAGVFYEFPAGTDRSRDNEPLIAAPGRMTADATVLKSGGESWFDLLANLAEYTGDFKASTQDWCDFSVTPNAGDPQCTRNLHAGSGTRYTNIPVSGIIGRTWEGHQYEYGSPNGFPVTFQYGKFGGRCVRPAAPY